LNKEDPYGQFADVMRGAMSTHSRQAVSGLGAVFGTITASGVKLDDFKHEVQDYLVAELPGTLGLPEREQAGAISGISDVAGGGTTGTGRFLLQKEEVEETVLSLGRGLKAGDRVLAMRVNGGNDIVVLCKVVSANA